MLVKGAPEKLWSLSKTVCVNGENVPISDEVDQMFNQANIKFGKGGERVLGFAKLELPKENYPNGTIFNVNSVEKFNFRLEKLTFIGLLSLIDPPKETVPEAIRKC